MKNSSLNPLLVNGWVNRKNDLQIFLESHWNWRGENNKYFVGKFWLQKKFKTYTVQNPSVTFLNLSTEYKTNLNILYVCMPMCMLICTVCMRVCMSTYACMHVCMHAWMCAWMSSKFIMKWVLNFPKTKPARCKQRQNILIYF